MKVLSCTPPGGLNVKVRIEMKQKLLKIKVKFIRLKQICGGLSPLKGGLYFWFSSQFFFFGGVVPVPGVPSGVVLPRQCQVPFEMYY